MPHFLAFKNRYNFKGSISRFYSAANFNHHGHEDGQVNQTPPATNSAGNRAAPSPSADTPRPWPQWVSLLEMLVKKGFLSSSEYGGDVDGKYSNLVRTACLNFARQRPDIINYLNRGDIHLVVKRGCPSLDRKVVNSGKRLRATLGIKEETVCRSCSLRGDCERAFVTAQEDEVGRTIDIVRILLTYGLDHVTSSIANRSCLTKKVKEPVSNLMNNLVNVSIHEHSSEDLEANKDRLPSRNLNGEIEIIKKAGDWNCPKCKFLNFARNMKCLHCDGVVEKQLRHLWENQEYLPRKKGDWFCEKCNFLNFAKNTKCLQCKEKPSNRNLNPGEWECPSCNYVNFRKNMLCLKCDWRRPKALNMVETHDGLHQEGKELNHPNRLEFVKEATDGEQTINSNGDHCPEFFSEHDGNCELNNEDFPIVGGKSAISKDRLHKEKWKTKNLVMSNDNKQHKGGNHEKIFANFNGGIPHHGTYDDEEMASWFGYGSKP